MVLLSIPGGSFASNALIKTTPDSPYVTNDDDDDDDDDDDVIPLLIATKEPECQQPVKTTATTTTTTTPVPQSSPRRNTPESNDNATPAPITTKSKPIPPTTTIPVCTITSKPPRRSLNDFLLLDPSTCKCLPASGVLPGASSSEGIVASRSLLHVEGICCTTETPIVTNILRNAGAGKVSVNITTRTVYVDHFPKDVSAAELATVLTTEGFPSRVKKDGGYRPGTADDVADGESRVRFVLSTFQCSAIDSNSSIDTFKSVLKKSGLLGDKVRRVSLPNVASKTIKLEHDPERVSAQDLADVLMTADCDDDDVTVIVDGDKEGIVLPNSSKGSGMETLNKSSDGRCLWCLPNGLGMNIVLSGIFWAVSIAGMLVEQIDYLQYTGLLSVIFGIPSVTRKAFRALKRKQFDTNSMMATAAFGALALGEFEEAASVAFLFSISEFLEQRATRKARVALDEIVNLSPDHANLVNPATGDITIVPVEELEIGDVVCVRTGDQIPSDGIVEEGSSHVDESSLTGESVPVGKHPGDIVAGGTINAGQSRLLIRTTVPVKDSAVSRLIKLVEESASHRSPTELVVDSFARSYTPKVLFVAFVMSTLSWCFGVEEGKTWTLRGLIIVVIACPCALTISTPVTYAAGLAATAKKRIIVKGGARLEALGSVKIIVFDKTVMLTQGEFQLNHLVVMGERKTRREVLELLSVMEAPSSHPLAKTLVNAAKKEGVLPSNHTSTVTNHSILKGEGVTAFVNGEQVWVGNTKLFNRLGQYSQLPNDQKQTAAKWDKDGGTVGFLGIENVGIIAMFCVSDRVRPEAKDVITELVNERGCNIMMLTGDGDGAARAIAEEVGLPGECVRSQFLPEAKLHFVSSLLASSKRTGHIFSEKELLLFIGDGVNDAPALAIADIGVAMGAGAALSMEISDVTLMDSHLSKLLFAIETGAKVIKTVKENIFLSTISKFLVIALTFAGKMTLLAAIAADVGVMLLVSLNGMKLLPDDNESEQYCWRRMRCRRRRRRRYDAESKSRGHYDVLSTSDTVSECESDIEVLDIV
eukprot:CAMPEP_0172519442 /NCGR_PEP_ID=MMETSP1066-20121228/291418_1 /TAXON_ID=671091 /ORGANISM="Coscinodiscus wailesii, Strain CCMP2513" /LENGTH=1043 /DNA_ID=CAMNT_0013302033 /DNA_START=55 /DNA_END=3186 /DNA_ORIENTATION=+